MGVSIDTGGGHGARKSVDVEFNLVPFIDMMSVMVSFLLITAVWTNLAQIAIKPGGQATDAQQPPPDPPPVNLSVLVANDRIWVGVTNAPPRIIDKVGGDYNFDALQEALQYYKKDSGLFNDREDCEIAAEDHVDYQSIIAAMDSAIAKGFNGLKYVDPQSLSVKFKQ